MKIEIKKVGNGWIVSGYHTPDGSYPGRETDFVYNNIEDLKTDLHKFFQKVSRAEVNNATPFTHQY